MGGFFGEPTQVEIYHLSVPYKMSHECEVLGCENFSYGQIDGSGFIERLFVKLSHPHIILQCTKGFRVIFQ